MFHSVSNLQHVQTAGLADRRLMPPPTLLPSHRSSVEATIPVFVPKPKSRGIAPIRFVSHSVQKGTFGGYAKTGDDAPRKTAVTYSITYKYTRPNYVVTDDPNLWNDSQMVVEDVNTAVPEVGVGNASRQPKVNVNAKEQQTSSQIDTKEDECEHISLAESSEKFNEPFAIFNILEDIGSDDEGDADPSEVERIILGLDTAGVIPQASAGMGISVKKQKKSRSASKASNRSKDGSSRKKRHSKYKNRKNTLVEIEEREIAGRRSKKKKHRKKEKEDASQKRSISAKTSMVESKSVKSSMPIFSERLEELTEPLSPEPGEQKAIKPSPSRAGDAWFARNHKLESTNERESCSGVCDRVAGRMKTMMRSGVAHSDYSVRTCSELLNSDPKSCRSLIISSRTSRKVDPGVKDILDLIGQHISKDEGQVLSDMEFSDTESMVSISAMSVFKQNPTGNPSELTFEHKPNRERNHSSHSRSGRLSNRSHHSSSRSHGQENPPRCLGSLSPMNHRKPVHRRSLNRSRRRSSSPSVSMVSKDRNLAKPTSRRYRASSYDTIATDAIDRIKLREIAIQNAVEFRKSGRIPPQYAISREERRIWQSGGKSLDELTAFCKRMAQREKRKDDDDDGTSVMSDLPVTNHPYHIKDRPLVNEINMNIRNSRMLPVRSVQERLLQNLPLRELFPVSSGSIHRDMTWQRVVVSRDKPVQELVIKFPEPKKPNSSTTDQDEPQICLVEQLATAPSLSDYRIPISFSDKLRLLRFQRDLAANPMQETHQQMMEWANQFVYQGIPGEFNETQTVTAPGKSLHQPWEKQAWVRRDQLLNLSPVQGKGHYLLQKMGWHIGQRIGLRQTGDLEPIRMEIKLNKRGLVASGEKGGKPALLNVSASSPFLFAGTFNQHPCSALNEFCTKKGWGTPSFQLVSESGNSHRTMFLFQVEVNGVTYRPTVCGMSKKQAKAEAAQFCLTALGAPK